MNETLHLIVAVDDNDLELIKELDLSLVTNFSIALHKAISKGRTEIAHFILKHPEIKLSKSKLYLALLKAAEKGQSETFKLIHSKIKESPTQAPNEGTSAFYEKVLYEAVKGEHMEIVRYIVNEHIVYDYEAALYKAITLNAAGIVDLLSTPEAMASDYYMSAILEARWQYLSYQDLFNMMADKKGVKAESLDSVLTIKYNKPLCLISKFTYKSLTFST